MLDKMAREFMGIVSHLLKQPQPWIRDDRLLVPRERLVAMLDRYPYLTATDKLTTWRALHWIDADQEHFTVRVKEAGKTKRVVRVDLNVYQELCELREKAGDRDKKRAVTVAR